MRLIFLLSLVASAVLAHSSSRSSWQKTPTESALEEEAFRPGREYRFHFDSQLASGLPVPSSDKAVTRVQSLVSLVLQSESTALLQIQTIRMASVQGEIDTPKEIQPFEIAEEIKLHEDHANMLRMPVFFRYEKGMISELVFDKDDQAWSANIKRAIINMLQVNIDKKNVKETEVLERESSPKGEETYTTTNEVTLEGECDATYTIVPEQESSRREQIVKITKSINFEKCENRAGTRYNFRFGDECPTCENKYKGEERNIESSTVLSFRVRRDSGSRFIIRETELKSTYTYSPLSEKETFFTSFVLNRLVLVSVESSPIRIPQPKSEKKETLLYSTEWEQLEERFLAEGDDSVASVQPYPTIKNKPELVARFVKVIVEKSAKKELGVELSATREMARLVKVLRMCTKEELRRIHSEVCENASEDKVVRDQMRDIINDALALAGTYNTIEHLAEKIKSRQLTPAKSAVVLKHLTNVRTPSRKMLDQILVPLCKDVKRNPVERQACWLTVGALLNGVCGENRDRLALSVERTGKECTREHKEKYVQEMLEMFEKTEIRYEKTLALKTMANSGIDLIVFPLEKIIKDESEERTIRVEAIDALRKLRSVMPRKVQSILLPIYKNTRLAPELRIAAFHQIMQTMPERAVLDQIAEQLSWEPCQQVHHFVYTALEQYAPSEIPCEKRMAENIKASLKMARVPARKAFSSRLVHYPIYSEEHKAGAALNWATIFANDSVLPKEVMASLETTFAGQWHKYLAQVGFSQQNIDQALYKFAKKIEEQGLEQVLVRGKRSSSSFQPAEMLRSLFSKLSITSRKQADQDPHALVYIRFRDNDFAVLPIDEEVIPEMVKSVLRNGRVELGEIEAILAKGYRFSTTFSTFVYERTRSIATSAGFPLVFSSKMPTIAKLSGLIQAEITPKSGSSFEGLKLKIAAHPSIASTHITKMEILSPVVNHGVKLLHSAQANVPVDMLVELEWQDKWELKTTYTLPKEDTRLVQVLSRPVTFVRVWPKDTRVYVEPKEKTIYVEQYETLVHNIDKSYLEKATGVKINVRGHVHGHIFEQGTEQLPPALLIGENRMEIAFEKTEQTPREYVVKIELDNFKEESRMEKPSFDAFFEDKQQEFFEVDSSEYVSEKEKERRDSFKSYAKSYDNGRSYKHSILAQIKSVGGRNERLAKVQFNTVCDEKMRHCNFELSSERTPIYAEETRDWTMKTSAKVLYPEMPNSIEELLNQKHREVVAEIQSVWGSEHQNTLKLKIQGEQNKEQKKWMKRAVEMKERKQENRLTALEEYSLLVEAAMLNQYKISADYKIESPVCLSYFDKLYSLAKYWAPYMNTEIELARNEPRSVRAVLSLEPETRQYLNLTIETPKERVKLTDLRLPFPMRLVNIRRHSVSPIRSFSDLSYNLRESYKAECKVESRKVNTFDDVLFKAPLTTCYSVLAKDCSSEEPEFAVLMKKVEKRGEEKKMKIITRKDIIEIEKRRSDDDLKITVNGKQIKEEEKLEKYGIFLSGRELVVIKMDELKVEFDGYTAQIKMSDYYKNKQCGLCGHFDGESDNDFRRADNQLTEEIEDFHRSFLVKDDDECQMQEEELREKKNYRRLSEESSSEEDSIFSSRVERKKNDWSSKKSYTAPRYSEEQEIVEPEEKTRVEELSERVCFSEEPVPECPRKSYEKEDELKKIEYTFRCLRRSSTEASRLIREARRGLVSVSSPVHTYTKTISVPKACIVY